MIIYIIKYNIVCLMASIIWCYWFNRVSETQHPIQTIKKNGEIGKNNSTQLPEESNWGCYARGALYALQSRGNHLVQVGNNL